jgi:E3 ubiquitin-protein ligase ATL6/9/15/31/42/55
MMSEPDGHRRVVPLHTGDGEVEVVVVRDDVDKYYAHSLTFAGFIIDGDVAAGDWNPEVFQVKTDVPAVVASSQR